MALVALLAFSACGHKGKEDKNVIRTFKAVETDVEGYYIDKRNADGQILECIHYDADDTQDMYIEYKYYSQYLLESVSLYTPSGVLIHKSGYTVDDNGRHSSVSMEDSNGVYDTMEIVDAKNTKRISELKESGTKFQYVEYDVLGRPVRSTIWHPDGFISDTVSEYDKYGVKSETTYDANGNETYRIEWTIIE